MKPNHSSFVRITSNYARLFLTLIIGVFVVRILLRFGPDAWGLISLLGTGTGLVLMLKHIVRTSTVPILGQAFHSNDPVWFQQVFNSAIVCSLFAAVLSVFVFGSFAACLPLLNFPQELNFAAHVFVISSAVHSSIAVAINPLINFYVVSERMVAHNAVQLFERIGDIISATATFLIFGANDPSTAIISYGICSSTLYVLINLIAAIAIILADKNLIPNLNSCSRPAISAFLKSVGWNGCVIFAINLHARVDLVIMNLFFGLIGNGIFSLANTFVGYMRQTIFGLVAGLDAVAARIANQGKNDALLQLLQTFARIQAAIIFPAVVLLLVYVEPLISFWLMGRIQWTEYIPDICWLARILIFGVAARCLSEGWMSIMNGSGNVKKYAPFVLIGGVLNPILSWFALSLFPENLRFASVAFVFSSLLIVVHLIAIPVVVARTFSMRFLSILKPFLTPGLVVLFSVFGAYFAGKIFADQTYHLLAFGITFCGLYSLLAYFVVLDSKDRSRIVQFANPSTLSRIRKHQV